ncbi:MAG: M56 family metallopeptidase [Phycisphaerales bacterium]|nr:MAG: M56 family metallopeptidase [Phycisphaerales bacterium]
MGPVLGTLVEGVNACGERFCEFAQGMFVQVTVLVGLLLMLDLLLRRRRRVSPCFRYGLWLLVLVKLLLPPSLALPTGLGYWIRPEAPVAVPGRLVTPTSFSDAPVLSEGTERAGASVPAAPSSDRAEASLERPGMFFLLWLTVVAWFLLHLSRRYRRMRHEIRRAQPAPDWLLRQLAECQGLLHARQPVAVGLSDSVTGPVICGFRRPVLLLPAGVPARLSPAELRAVLGHELVHVQRRDTWVNLAQSLLQILYFYHPLVWVANHMTARLREQAVDVTVLAALKLKVAHYTRTLIHVAEMAYRQPAPSVCFVGLAESRRALKERITQMARYKNSERVRRGWVGLIVIVVVGAVLVPMGRGRPAQPEPAKVEIEVPALPEAIPELFELSKDEVLERFGRSPNIFYGDERYTLDNLPEMYYLAYEDISFRIHEDEVAEITVVHPRYVFGNGIRVGATEAEVIAAFGQEYTIREFEPRDFLAYKHLGVMFEIYKPERIAREINIYRDYGDPKRLRAYKGAGEFARLLPERIARLRIDKADLAEVKNIFGEPVKYIWGKKTFEPDKLPERFIAVYPSGFRVFMSGGRIVELRFERGPANYAFMGLRVGSTLEEALKVLGKPDKVVTGKENAFVDRVLYKDIEGRKGHCYYRRSDHQVRLWFGDYKIIAIYLTRSDYGEGGHAGPFDEAFNAKLPDRIARLNIDQDDRQTVETLFGKPLKYVWARDTFSAEDLPKNYILVYPCSFRVWMQGDKIMEIRHEGGSQYVYASGVRVGASLDAVLKALGDPAETVVGQENTFKDKVLYRDIAGREGHCYYHRSDQQVRIWFGNNRVAAIYMTRSDFPTK